MEGLGSVIGKKGIVLHPASQGGAAEQIGMEQEGMALYPEIFPVVIIAQHLAGRYEDKSSLPDNYLNQISRALNNNIAYDYTILDNDLSEKYSQSTKGIADCQGSCQ